MVRLIMNNLSAFGPATHVAFDSFTTERLLQLGATDPVRASDNLLIGPCRRDPAEHERVREAWWSSSEKWDRLYSPEVRWKTPVVLWVSASISQRVNLWRACHWLRQKGNRYSGRLIVEVDPLPPPKAPEEPMPPSGR